MPLPPSEYISNVWKPNIFDKKTVFCTGGAGSICSAQVRALVHLGANACIIGRNTAKTEDMAIDIATARPGARVVGIGGVDVRNADDVKGAADRCAAELGGIDFVIAGAAGNFLAPITQLSTNAFKSVIDIDVLGSYNTLKATLPHLAAAASRAKSSNAPGGRIIFISATIHYTALPLQSHVAVAKAGIDALSASCAIELGPRGITSNIIAPGAIAGTEGMERLARKEGGARGEDGDGKGETGTGTGTGTGKGVRGVPLQRLGHVRDVADATVYLFSQAGDYVSGGVLVVDGAAWRVAGANPGAGFAYPDFLLGDQKVTGGKTGREREGGRMAKAKAKL